jgi:hypothetical protein
MKASSSTMLLILSFVVVIIIIIITNIMTHEWLGRQSYLLRASIYYHMKENNLLPVFKGGSSASISNYRLNNIISTFSKVFEFSVHENMPQGNFHLLLA